MLPGLNNVSTRVQGVSDSLMKFMNELFDKSNELDTTVKAVSAKVEEIAKNALGVLPADELVSNDLAGKDVQ